jgi:hypothetical protein
VNPSRVAELLRELADEFESVGETASKPPVKARRRPSLVRPAGEAPPVVAAQATRILRERGFR